MGAVFIPEALFCMWLKPPDSYIQKDNSHGIRTSVPEKKSLFTESLLVTDFQELGKTGKCLDSDGSIACSGP
jgi:hypothetical protein